MGAVRAAQWDQVGVCRAGGAEAPLLGTAGSPCQSTAMGDMAAGNIGSTGAGSWHAQHLCGAGTCPSWQAWIWHWFWELGGWSRQGVLAYTCVCVSARVMLCHLVLSHAGTGLSRASSCWPWGRAEHHLQWCQSPAQPCPGTGRQGAQGTLLLPTSDPVMEHDSPHPLQC